MSEGNERFTGMIAPAVTPFENDEIRWDLFADDVRYLIDAGVYGIGVGGSTGEGAVLTDAELARLTASAAKLTRGQMPLVGGVIRNSTAQAVRAARGMREAGAEALLVTPPFYFGGTAEDNFDYYQAIAEEVGLPIFVYNVVPTNPISPELMTSLSRIPQVVGIKQVGPEALVQMVAKCPNGVLVHSACDTMLYSTYVAGAMGAISALVTVAPKLCVQQWQAFKNGDHAQAMSIQRTLAPVADVYSERPFPAKVKELLNLQGRRVGQTRRPLLPVSQRERGLYRMVLQRAGLVP